MIAATSTLAQGVNLPVRTVLMHSVWRHDEDRGQVRMDAREYWNIAGRAGRAGQETTGLTVHIAKDRKDASDFDFFASHRNQVEEITGAMFRLLLALTENRISGSDAQAQLDASLLPLLVEEIGPDLEIYLGTVDTTIQASFVRHQADSVGLDLEPLIATARSAAGRIVEEVPDPALRRVFATTGLSSRSCLSIQQRIKDDLTRIEAALSGTLSRDNLLNLVLESLGPIDEMQPTRPYPGDYRELVGLWVEGRSLPSISAHLREENSLEVGPETLSDFLNDYAMYRLPWGASAFIALALRELGIEPEDCPIEVAALPALLKFGVPDPVAGWMMGFGVSSRPLAIRLASAFREDETSSTPTRLRAWLGGQDSELLGARVSATGQRLRSLARACQRARRATVRAAIGQDELLPLTVKLEPLSGDNVAAALALMGSGASPTVDRDYESTLERNRMVLRVAGTTISVLPPDLSAILAVDVDAGLEVGASVTFDGALLSVSLVDITPF